MTRAPRDPKERIVNRRSIGDILWAGALIGVLAFANYLYFYSRAGVDPFSEVVPAELLAQAMSITYVTIMVCQLVSIIQRRSVRGFFTRYQFTNPTFWLAIGVALGLMAAILYVPFISGFFGTGPLGAVDWGFALLAAAVFLAIREGQRLLQARFSARSAASAQRPAA